DFGVPFQPFVLFGCHRPRGLLDAPPSRGMTPYDALRHDENIFPAPDHFVFAQPELAVADAFAGFELVFVAVPRPNEIHIVTERLALKGAVGRNDTPHPVDQQPFTSRPARMQAIIAVGIEGAVLEEPPDLVAAGGDDPPVAVR